jgi:hypothetical protein
MIKRHYIIKKKYELEAMYWFVFRYIAISIYILAGRWISLGFHLSFVPLYVDLHIGWFILSIMPSKRSEEIMYDEEAYLENM